VVHSGARRGEIGKFLLSVEIFHRDHVDGADQLAAVVVGQERSGRQRARIDVRVSRGQGGNQVASPEC
jgi:hypothetical protein